jgi:hypothetical protein
MSLHSIRLKVDVISPASSSTGYGHRNYSYDIIGDFFMRRAFQDLAGYPRILALLFKASSRSTRLQKPPCGRPCQTPCIHAWRSGCLYTSFNQDHALVFLLFLEHQTSHAACFNARGLLYECVFDTLLFSSSYRPVGNPFFIMSLLDLLFFFSSSFLDHHAGHPARHDARILLMSASSMPSKFFHHRFDLLEACFLQLVTRPLFVR